MELYLLRHGIAEDHSADGTDVSRRLTTEGAARIEQSAKGLRRLGVKLKTIYSSPLPRALSTAQIVAAELRVGVETVAELAPGCGTGQLLRILDGRNGSSIMVVGHEPDLGFHIGALTGGPAVPLKKGGLARLDLTLTEAGFGTLTWLLPPKVLRTLGGDS